MYDDLVKRLWECASGECFNCSQYTETTNASVCSKELMKQAADAIEELSAIRDEQKAQIILMAAETEEQQPRWIPVTERLPDARQFVLVWKDEKPKGFACVSFWMDNAGWAFKNITHWMPLPQPPKEE